MTALIEATTLSLGEKALYILLKEKRSISLKELHKVCCESRTTIWRMLNKLKSIGIISESAQPRSEGRFARKVILFSPRAAVKKMTRDKVQSETSTRFNLKHGEVQEMTHLKHGDVQKVSDLKHGLTEQARPHVCNNNKYNNNNIYIYLEDAESETSKTQSYSEQLLNNKKENRKNSLRKNSLHNEQVHETKIEPLPRAAIRKPLQPVRSCDMPEEKPFDKFWRVYPRKVGKKQAALAWKRAKLDSNAEQAEMIVTDVATRLTQHAPWLQACRSGDKTYVPHPATYINNERWEDEIESVFGDNHEKSRGSNAASGRKSGLQRVQERYQQRYG